MTWEAYRPLVGTFALIGVCWAVLRFEPWRWAVPLLRSWRGSRG